MKKWWIYIGKNNEGRIDCHYYRKPLEKESMPENLLFVGTAELEDDYFGERVIDKFKSIFDEYAEKYHKKKILELFNLK